MATVLVRNGDDDAWRVASPCWQDIPVERAEDIADNYNKRDLYDTEYKVRGGDQ